MRYPIQLIISTPWNRTWGLHLGKTLYDVANSWRNLPASPAENSAAVEKSNMASDIFLMWSHFDQKLDKIRMFLASMVVVRCWTNHSKTFCMLLRITYYRLKNLFSHWFWKLPLTFTIFHQSNDRWTLKKAIDDRRYNCDEFLLIYCSTNVLQAR